MNKIDLLRVYACESKPSIIFVTETWSSAVLTDAYFFIDGYSCFRSDRCNGTGGGVMIYVSKNVSSVIVKCETFDDGRSEALTVKVILNEDCSIVCSCVYIPPAYVLRESPVLSYLNGVADLQADYLIVCGDFNCPDIRWDLCESSAASAPILQWCLDNFLLQNVNEPTRPLSQSLLDVVFSSVSTNICNVAIKECFGNSDHSIVSFSMSLPFETDESNVPDEYYLDLTKVNWNSYRECLAKMYWPPITSNSNIDATWEIYVNNILRAVKATANCRKKTPFNRYNSARVRTSLRALRRAFSQYESSPTPINKWRYQQAQSRLQYSIHKNITETEYKICNEIRYGSNVKPFWKYIRNRLKFTEPITYISDESGIIKDSEAIANHFNEYFTSFFTKDDSNFNYEINQPRSVLNNVNFSSENIFSIMQPLPSSQSTDSEGLNYLVIKKGGQFLASKLAALFSLSLSTCQIPNAWRRVIITPVYKSGSKNICKNYRPIAVSSCICRLMERIIYRSLMDFFTLNARFISSQHGFLRDKSTDTAAIAFHEFLTSNLDEGNSVDVVLFDYSKAFDSVNHNILLHKLWNFGIRGNLFKWLTNFLQERTQIVKVNSRLSTEANINSGVIQG